MFKQIQNKVIAVFCEMMQVREINNKANGAIHELTRDMEGDLDSLNKLIISLNVMSPSHIFLTALVEQGKAAKGLFYAVTINEFHLQVRGDGILVHSAEWTQGTEEYAYNRIHCYWDHQGLEVPTVTMVDDIYKVIKF